MSCVTKKCLKIGNEPGKIRNIGSCARNIRETVSGPGKIGDIGNGPGKIRNTGSCAGNIGEIGRGPGKIGNIESLLEILEKSEVGLEKSEISEKSNIGWETSEKSELGSTMAVNRVG